MTQEEKSLLLKDLCARLPYGVLCYINDDDTNTPRKLSRIEVDELDGILLDFWTGREDCPYMQVYLSEVKPYLRQMSSMSEYEREELEHLSEEYFGKALDKQIQESLSPSNRNESEILEYIASSVIVDWLNAHHVDYRGLIEKGLALPC